MTKVYLYQDKQRSLFVKKTMKFVFYNCLKKIHTIFIIIHYNQKVSNITNLILLSFFDHTKQIILCVIIKKTSYLDIWL